MSQGGGYGGRDQNGYGGYGMQMPQMGSPRPGGNMYQSWMNQSRPQGPAYAPTGTTGGNIGTDLTGRFGSPAGPGAITNHGTSGGNMFNPGMGPLEQQPGAMTGGNMQPGLSQPNGYQFQPQPGVTWDPPGQPGAQTGGNMDPRSRWMGRNTGMNPMQSGPFIPRY